MTNRSLERRTGEETKKGVIEIEMLTSASFQYENL